MLDIIRASPDIESIKKIQQETGNSDPNNKYEPGYAEDQEVLIGPNKEEIREIIRAQQNNKMLGENGITSEIIKLGRSVLEKICKVIQEVWEFKKNTDRLETYFHLSNIQIFSLKQIQDNTLDQNLALHLVFLNFK